MLYGLGSKRRLLDMFRTEMLSDWSHVVVNGYFPGLLVKNVSPGQRLKTAGASVGMLWQQLVITSMSMAAANELL